MLKPYLVAAALLGASGIAQAEVAPTAPTADSSSGFLASWTGSHGIDIVASGVLSGDVSLVGGVAYGSDNLAKALFANASATVGQNASELALSFADGINGRYLLGTSNHKLAAMLGAGTSVVSSNGGWIISSAPKASSNAGGGGGGGGGGSWSPGGGSGSSGGAGGGKGSSGSPGAGTGAGTDGGSGAGLGGSGGTGGTGGAGGTGGTGGTGAAGANGAAGGTQSGSGGVDTAGQLDNPSNTVLDFVPAAGGRGTILADGQVPEPSTIMLLAIGMLGASSLARRRAR